MFKRDIHKEIDKLYVAAAALEAEALDRRAAIQAQIDELAVQSKRYLDASIRASRIANA